VDDRDSVSRLDRSEIESAARYVPPSDARVVERMRLGSEWLEAAVVAGHVPYLEGIVLALRARHRLYKLAIVEHEASGSVDDARRATLVGAEYRRIASLCALVRASNRLSGRASPGAQRL
jgi:hypothetical protein